MLRTGQAQKVFFGADRVAANGDVANKIGTYMLALAAHANDVPVYPVVPSSTVDLTLPDGRLHPDRGARCRTKFWISKVHGEQVMPKGRESPQPRV